MIRTGENLYQDMQADMVKLLQKELDPRTEIESCFVICTNYWTELQKKLVNYRFEKVKDEIFFFKKLKPLFTSEIEFYGLKHYGQLFKESTNDAVELMAFWKRESSRLNKFKSENEDFYHYYKTDSTEFDEEWFVRVNNDLSYVPAGDIAEVDLRSSTSHDWMVARVMALEKYRDYVELEMRLLQHEQFHD